MLTYEFLLIWLAWLLAGASPGPATLGIAGTAMASGRLSALWFALGILAGSASWGLAAALGMAGIMQTNVWVFETVRYAGVAYLAWLAIKAAKRALSAQHIPLASPFSGSPKILFLKGAAVHITNPKAILSWGSIYAIILPDSANLLSVLQVFAMLYAGSILIFAGYAVLFSNEAIASSYAKMRRPFDLAFAGLFGFASYKILTASQP